MSKGLEALDELMENYYNMCLDTGNNDDQYQKWNLTSPRAIIEKELKAFEILLKGLKMRFYDDANVVILFNPMTGYDTMEEGIVIKLNKTEYLYIKEVFKNDKNN